MLRKPVHADDGDDCAEEDGLDAKVRADADSATNRMRSAAELSAEAYVNTVALRQFTPDMVNPDALILVIGKRRFGKTIWSEWLLSHLWPIFREVYVFTTTKFNNFWSKHVPDDAIYEGIQWDVIAQIKERQREVVRLMEEQGDKCQIVPYICIIFEDVASERTAMKFATEMKDLAFMGRHYMIFMIFMLQDVKSAGVDIRGNADFVALTYQTQARTMESAQEDWGDWWGNRWVFRELIRKYTQDHGLLVVAQPKAVYSATDAMYHTRATDPEELRPYRLGHYQQWKELKCNWESQNARYERYHAAQTRTRGVVLQLALKHLNAGEQERADDLKAAGTEDRNRDESNQIEMAPPATRQAFEAAVAKKNLGDGEAVALAEEAFAKVRMRFVSSALNEAPL